MNECVAGGVAVGMSGMRWLVDVRLLACCLLLACTFRRFGAKSFKNQKCAPKLFSHEESQKFLSPTSRDIDLDRREPQCHGVKKTVV
jgi:hypothetical protein